MVKFLIPLFVHLALFDRQYTTKIYINNKQTRELPKELNKIKNVKIVAIIKLKNFIFKMLMRSYI